MTKLAEVQELVKEIVRKAEYEEKMNGGVILEDGIGDPYMLGFDDGFPEGEYNLAKRILNILNNSNK